MKYFIVEKLSKLEKTAWSKARNDVEEILASEGYQPLEIFSNFDNRSNMSTIKKIRAHLCMKKIWEEKLSILKSGDSIFFQFPVVHNSIFLHHILKKLKSKGIKIIALIHDMESIRLISEEKLSFLQKLRIKIEEFEFLKASSYLITPNKYMRKFLEDKKIKVQMGDLEIFDYLISQEIEKKLLEKKVSKKNSIVIAGNLSKEKSAYVYSLPINLHFELYGVNYIDSKNSQTKNIIYNGSYMADELPFVLNAEFGLVWDGPSVETCEGGYGKYLMYNNPHKASLYLVSGIPIIIWEKAALANFIVENKIGFTISSLNDINEKLEGLSDEEYRVMKQNTIIFSERLSKGFYLKKIIRNI